MKKIIIVGAVILAILIGAFFIFHKPPQPLATSTIKYNNITETATAVGNIEPIQTSTVKAQVAGIVTTIFHNNGDFVNIGEKLLVIKPYPPPTTLATNLYNVNQDQITLNNDLTTYKNYLYLKNERIVPSNYSQLITAKKAVKLDRVKLTYDNQIKQLSESGKTSIGGRIIQTTVVSPITGYILQRLTSVGDTINSIQDQQAATSLFVMANMQNLIFNGSVDELDTGKIKPNMPANITIAAYPKHPLQGKVEIVSLQSKALDKLHTNLTSASTSTQDPFNNGFTIKIFHITKPKSLTLRSGYSATATITILKLTHVLTVPMRLLVYKDNKTYVKIPVNTFKSKLQAITTGINDGNNIQVLSGLKAGDKIITGTNEKNT